MTKAPHLPGSRPELDAIEPDTLRALVQIAIEDHLPPQQFKVLKAAEESERTLIRQLVGGMGGGGARHASRQ